MEFRMSEDTKKEEQINQLKAEKDIGEKEAQKEVAQKGIEEITGKTANRASQETREILEVYDALESQNLKEINKEKRDTDLKTVKEFQEKIDKNPTLADDLVKAGLGSEQLSITAGKLEDRIDEVAQEMEIHGEANSEQKKENPQNTEKSEQEFSSQENNSDDLLLPPILPQDQKNQSENENISPQEDQNNTQDNKSQNKQNNIKNILMEASKNGAKLTFDAIKEGQKLSTTVANASGEVVGTVAQKGTEKVLGNGVVGKTGGKIAKDLSSKAVSSFIKAQIGNVGK